MSPHPQILLEYHLGTSLRLPSLGGCGCAGMIMLDPGTSLSLLFPCGTTSSITTSRSTPVFGSGRGYTSFTCSIGWLKDWATMDWSSLFSSLIHSGTQMSMRFVSLTTTAPLSRCMSVTAPILPLSRPFVMTTRSPTSTGHHFGRSFGACPGHGNRRSRRRRMFQLCLQHRIEVLEIRASQSMRSILPRLLDVVRDTALTAPYTLVVSFAVCPLLALLMFFRLLYRQTLCSLTPPEDLLHICRTALIAQP